MKTNIEAKFKLIEILNISPVELSYIKDLTIPENIVSELLNGESCALKVHLENIQNDETLPVDTRLLAACLKNRMKDSVIRIKMDGLDEDEDDEVEEENYGYFDEDLTEEEKEAIKENEKERNKMWRDREIEFHKSIPILKKYTQEEMNSVMFNYIWEHFPLLQKGFDRKIYPKARDSFFGHIGIAYYRYQLPQKVQDKINIADDYVKNEIINRFKKLEIESIDKWAIQYKQSMDELGVKKYTKSSIKGFFDELGLKVSSIVIDTIKSKL